MPKLDEIKRLIQLAGYKPNFGESPAVEKLADLLDEQEEVVHVANGTQKAVSGLLMTTDSRLLFAGLPAGKKAKSDLKVISIPYDRITAIGYGGGALGFGKISVTASGADTVFACDSKQVKAISEHIHSRAPDASPLVEGKLPTTSNSRSIGSAVAVVMIGVALVSVFSSGDKSGAAPVREPQKQQIAKKDGTIDPRANDLDELCKDWVYFKAKAYKYGREGDQQAAQEARAKFQQTNVWLEQYNESDVSRTCAQYDTKENLTNYMR